MKKSIFLTKSKKFKKDLTFIVIEGETINKYASTYCEIGPSEESPIQGHYRIEVYHPLGGGEGGWDSYREPIGIAHGKKELPKQIRQCAFNYAQKLAKKSKEEFIDLTRRKECYEISMGFQDC